MATYTDVIAQKMQALPEQVKTAVLAFVTHPDQYSYDEVKALEDIVNRYGISLEDLAPGILRNVNPAAGFIYSFANSALLGIPSSMGLRPAGHIPAGANLLGTVAGLPVAGMGLLKGGKLLAGLGKPGARKAASSATAAWRKITSSLKSSGK